MTDLHVRSVRGTVQETVHEIAAVVTDERGSPIATLGDPDRLTPWRSAAKPFQALPLIEDGASEEFAITTEELALACASHNSEQYQVDLVRDFLTRIGFAAEDLACGPHRALAKDLTFHVDDGTRNELASPSRLASNCSGKHTGMLGLAKRHGWDSEGYHTKNHPVQRRCRKAVSQSCGMPEDSIDGVVDGCGVVCWVTPLRALAVGYTTLALRGSEAAREIVKAMTTRPDLVAGRQRLCTSLMEAFPGRVLAKVGADGVYGASLLEPRVGVAIKVSDGSSKAAAVALLAILDQLELLPGARDALPAYAEPVILNTRREPVGKYEAVGSISFV